MPSPSLVLTALLPLAIGLGMLFLQSPDHDQVAQRTWPPPVPRIERTVEEHELLAIAHTRQPVVLARSPARGWRALDRWTPEYLQRHLGNVSAYTHTESSFITFHDHKPLEFVLPPTERSHHTTKRNISITQLYQEEGEEGDTQQGSFYHFSMAMDAVAAVAPALLADITPHQAFFAGTEGRQINMWLGRAGLATHMHFDATWNFFVQVRGQKWITLVSPAASVSQYPCLHPFYGHARASLDEVPRTVDNSHVMVAEVSAGEVLAIPPYWWHHVQTCAPSVSVNVWALAPEYITLETIYRMPIPFEATWPHAMLLSSLRVWIDLLVRRALLASVLEREIAFGAGGGAAHVQKSLVARRYAHLLTTHWAKPDTQMAAVCARPTMTLFDDDSLLIDKIEAGLNKPVTALQSIKDLDIRATCIFNYIEHVVALVVEPTAVIAFFATCAH